MARLNGNAMVITSSGLPIAASTSCTLDIKGKTIDVAGADQGLIDEAVAGLKEWTVTVDTFYLLTRGRTMAQELMDGTRLELTIMIGDNKKLYGYAYVSDYTVSGSTKNKVTCKMTMRGTGPISSTQYFDYAIQTGTTYSNYKVAGHEMMLAVDDEPLALLTDTELSMQRTMQELEPTSAGWRQYVPRRYSWDISADGLINAATPDTGVRSMAVGDTLDVVMRIGLDKYSGSVVVESLKTSGPLKEKASASVKARGTSEIELVTPESSYFDYELGFVF